MRPPNLNLWPLPRTDLEPAGQELALHLQVVALVDLRLEGLIEDHVSRVVLDVLPAGIAMPRWGPLRATRHRVEWREWRGTSPGFGIWLSRFQTGINLGCKRIMWVTVT